MATPLPKNRAPFSLAEIVLATGGEALGGSPSDRAVGVSSDSRTVTAGEVFVALVGDRFDGHEHARTAAERGAAVIVASRPIQVPSGTHVVRVDDTLAALGALGRAHRRRWAGRGAKRVVGITGSAGKTTTRHVVAALLGNLGRRVLASVGNLNNAIGVPHVLFCLDDNHDDAVIEIGMSTPGEILRTAALVEPDAGVVTLVSDAHTEGVGSIWGVLREKSSLFETVRPGGLVVVNADDAGARAALVRAAGRRHLLYGEANDADVRLVRRVARGLAGSDLTLEIRRASGEPTRVEMSIPLLGAAGAYAALAAASVAIGFDDTLADRPEVLSRVLADVGGAEGGRLSPRVAADGTLVIDDAYNANPASMIASIRAAREIADAEGRRLVLVLGVMRELGARSDELHAEVGAAAAAASPAALVVVSTEAMARAAEAAGASPKLAADATAAVEVASTLVSPGDVVLVKASNSLGLSLVAARLAERTNP
ncbi:MAG: UDP-N-acetylmuramoyl-tripeptide--D-alanyl-D-alanine ligase [Myxococcales bacterium]|nr:UDP-N-acetylmuramoyl-tripeptide--D-alanyl-D-alanine ligase [Myxococcales bacterium]